MRQSGQSTKEYHGKDIEVVGAYGYLSGYGRAESAVNEVLEEHAQAVEIGDAEVVCADETAAPASRAPEPSAETTKEKNKPSITATNTIATSAWRPNVLHS